MKKNRIGADVGKKLRHYVYLYLDPATKRPFYVGKGQWNRAFSHLKSRKKSNKLKAIERLRTRGHIPIIDVLRSDLNAEEAFLVEAAAIDLLGMMNLTNQVRGHGSRKSGRARIEELIATMSATPAKITDPVVLIKITRNIEDDMAPSSLYDRTRSAWKISKEQRDNVDYALSVFQGIVREVYEIADWFPHGATMQSVDRKKSAKIGRWEFVGNVAHENIRNKYIGKSVLEYFPKGAQNPIRFPAIDGRVKNYERDPGFIASIARARKQVKQGKVVRHEDMRRNLKIK